jgi:hypothetical protein
VNLFVQYTEVEVVASAKLRFRHDKIIPFPTYHNPNYSSRRFESVFFYSALFNSIKRLGEALPKELIEVV